MLFTIDKDLIHNSKSKSDVEVFSWNRIALNGVLLLRLLEHLLTFVLAPASIVICLCVLYQGGLIVVSAAFNLLAYTVRRFLSVEDNHMRKSYRQFRKILIAIVFLAWFRPEINNLYLSGSGPLEFSSAVLGSISANDVYISIAAKGPMNVTVAYHILTTNLNNSTQEISTIDVLIGNSGITTVHIENLKPSTNYSYIVMFASSNEASPSQDDITGTFSTLPSQKDSDSTIRFSSSSCAQRRLAWGKTFSGFELVKRQNPMFFLFLGDIIYADVPRGLGYSGLGFGQKDELYRTEYLTVRSERNAQSLFSNVPTFFQFDDHEIYNDMPGRIYNPEIFDVAVRNWKTYIGAGNPVIAEYSDAIKYYYFQAGLGDFFVLDTKTFRDPKKQEIIGSEQITQLQRWLNHSVTSDPSRFKFIISPVTLTRNRPEAHEGWNCCERERSQVLSLLRLEGVHNVVFITGDTHKPGIFELSPNVYEVGVSPIDAFGPRVWGIGKDRTLYEETGFTTAFATYTLGPSTLKVEIYGGGYHVSTQIAVIISIFVGFYVLIRTVLKSIFTFTPGACFSLLSALLLGLVIVADDLTNSQSFHHPRFVMEIDRVMEAIVN